RHRARSPRRGPRRVRPRPDRRALRSPRLKTSSSGRRKKVTGGAFMSDAFMSDDQLDENAANAANAPGNEGQPELGWAPKDDRSFWTRVKQAIAGAPEPASDSEPDPELPALPPADEAPKPLPVTTPKPRRVRRTAFEKARLAKEKDAES